MLDEEAERRAFQAAVMDWRRGPVSAAPAAQSATKPVASASTGMVAKGPGSPQRALAGSGCGGMFDGALDEAREHAVGFLLSISPFVLLFVKVCQHPL